MKVMFLATTYEYGGVSSVIKNILDNLEKEKFDIVFLLETIGAMHYPLKKDIKFIDMDLKPAKSVLKKLVNLVRHLSRIRKAIVLEEADVVVSFGSSVNCLLLLAFLFPARNMPKIILVECSEQIFIGPRYKTFGKYISEIVYKAIIGLLYRKADAIVCVSNSIARHLKRFYLINDKKIKVIHVSVNIKEIRILSQKETADNRADIDSAPCIGTVSRLSPEKGITYLVEAFSNLLKKTDARLILVGDGEERGKIEEMVKMSGIEDNVIFMGWLENPYNYLKKMDIFVLSSLWEGFPNVVLEAMACNVPVVAARCVRGMEEIIIDGVDGLLVPPADAKVLSDSIYNLLQDKELRNKFVEEASKKIGRFDAFRIAGQYKTLMADLVC